MLLSWNEPLTFSLGFIVPILLYMFLDYTIPTIYVYTTTRDNQYRTQYYVVWVCNSRVMTVRVLLGRISSGKVQGRGEQSPFKETRHTHRNTLYATTIKIPIPMYTQLFRLDNINPFSPSYITNKYWLSRVKSEISFFFLEKSNWLEMKY